MRMTERVASFPTGRFLSNQLPYRFGSSSNETVFAHFTTIVMLSIATNSDSNTQTSSEVWNNLWPIEFEIQSDDRIIAVSTSSWEIIWEIFFFGSENALTGPRLMNQKFWFKVFEMWSLQKRTCCKEFQNEPQEGPHDEYLIQVVLQTQTSLTEIGCCD